MSRASAPSSRPRLPTTRSPSTSKSRPSCRARIPARSSSAACAIPIGSGPGGGFEARRPYLHLALRQKNCRLRTAGHFLEKPPMSTQSMPTNTELRPNRNEDAQALEESARLRNDIRLLGRILGDTVRGQEGADVFDLVERIRQTSIRFHRDNDRPARRELEIILDGMSPGQTSAFGRAFSYFSHLANIAEDQNNIRQMRGRNAAGGSPRPGTLALT